MFLRACMCVCVCVWRGVSVCFCVWVESGRLDGRKWMCECFIKAATHRTENGVGDSRDMGLSGGYGEVGRR